MGVRAQASLTSTSGEASGEASGGGERGRIAHPVGIVGTGRSVRHLRDARQGQPSLCLKRRGGAGRAGRGGVLHLGHTNRHHDRAASGAGALRRNPQAGSVKRANRCACQKQPEAEHVVKIAESRKPQVAKTAPGAKTRDAARSQRGGNIRRADSHCLRRAVDALSRRSFRQRDLPPSASPPAASPRHKYCFPNVRAILRRHRRRAILRLHRRTEQEAGEA